MNELSQIGCNGQEIITLAHLPFAATLSSSESVNGWA